MWWLFLLPLQFFFIFAGIRRERRAGLWIWSKLVFALVFAAVEVPLLVVPMLTLDLQGRYFLPVFSSCCVVAVINFVVFIIVARRWRLPDGRTSIQAYRDSQNTR